VVTGKLDVREAAARLPEEGMEGVLVEDEDAEDLETEEEEIDLIDDADT
jgi:type I restriction enzyme S subunit